MEQPENSVPVKQCQICGSSGLESLLFLGYLPPVNSMQSIGAPLTEQTGYPAELFYCSNCHLVQLGLVVAKEILFPSSYPYTSSTTKVLRENFADLYDECERLNILVPGDMVVDIGSNDGNLLGNFSNDYKVLGITPEQIGHQAIAKGIPTLIAYFSEEVVRQIINDYGKIKMITATNVFAHIDDVNDTLSLITDLLQNDGVFVSESHYLLPLIESMQYDTIYHEHLRYYSLHSLNHLLSQHNMEVFHVKEIPSHGGSIRVYSARKGIRTVQESVKSQLVKEAEIVTGTNALLEFGRRTAMSKLKLMTLLHDIKDRGKSICAIGAPSRGSTLVNYVGLDSSILEFVCEVSGSQKIGKYLPGTKIPVVDEDRLFQDQPDYALLLSWHIGEELKPKLRDKGYQGKFISPLPEPRIDE